MRSALVALCVLALGVIACGSSEPRPKLNLYPTAEVIPTQTPVYIVHTQTPNATQTPFVVVVTQTPNAEYLCVSAVETVYLRPSPNADNYPIIAIPNAVQVRDIGGRSGDWYFVELGQYQGWVNSEYLSVCQGCNQADPMSREECE